MNIATLRKTCLFAPAIGLAAILFAIGCFRQDQRTITIRVPQMRSPACYALIQEALKKIEGIKSTRPDYEKRTVDVTYDALKLAIKNIEFVIAATGFQANDIEPPPDARARLPEDCR
ncbi:MAG: heavy-metal-associated domain-containing protein [Kiritimatiellae bacterium]|nr:heavy-metal-associated domain-containing protein [Kiritimatiellia bacterium]MDW8458226.1 heavy-metal-associated domain-containing protein [Verrucomicrobiota bacterium]